MTRPEVLRQLYADSLLAEVFSIRKEDDHNDHSSLRFVTNDFRIRAIEMWEHADGEYFRIYYAPEASNEIKAEIGKLPGQFRSNSYATDYRGNYLETAKGLRALLNSDSAKQAAQKNPVFARGFGYEGLILPDVDTSDDEILGRAFNWKEVIAIDQDVSSNNALKQVLSQCGVYLQRSIDGKARYVGSAYNDGGIFGRWMHHLRSNGDAKHLNFFILENGYNNVVFTVLEVTKSGLALSAESRWKATLGTTNEGPYDGYRLNCN